MLRQILSSIQGVEIYSILALLVFLAFFTVIFLHTMKIPKEEADSFSRLPFVEEDHIQSFQENELKK
ncbi:MAG: cbb3-type cytochrome c oxidase subunit 3 [Bacteroidota bacterium]